MANFNISIEDLVNGNALGNSIITSQKNYTPTGQSKAIVTSESLEKEPKKSLTTANVSDILQGQLLVKDRGLVSTKFNETLSNDMARLLKVSINGVNTKISRSLSGLVGYDIPNSRNVKSAILDPGTAISSSNSPVSPASTGSTNNGVPKPIPESGTVIDYALCRVGCQYVWAASGPDTFDCSGFIMWSYGKTGISLPHYSGAQYSATARISKDQLQPGDLIFWGPNASEHVAMYLGNNQMIHAFDGVQVTNFEGWWKEPFGYGRVIR